MRDFTSEKGDAGVADVFARPAAKYLVVDIGGNLIDRNSTQLITFNYLVFECLTLERTHGHTPTVVHRRGGRRDEGGNGTLH